jgi:integrase
VSGLSQSFCTVDSRKRCGLPSGRSVSRSRRCSTSSAMAARKTCWISEDRSSSGLNSTRDAVCRRAGLNFVLYDFRHTFATRMAQAGVDLATLGLYSATARCGASSANVHPTAEHQRDAMARYDAALQAWETRERVH